MKKAEGFFPLSPRGTSGERAGERGKCDEKRPPLPGPLLLFWEEKGEDSKNARQREARLSRLPTAFDGRLDKPGDRLSIFPPLMQMAQCFQSAVDLLFPCHSLFLQRFAETARCLGPFEVRDNLLGDDKIPVFTHRDLQADQVLQEAIGHLLLSRYRELAQIAESAQGSAECVAVFQAQLEEARNALEDLAVKSLKSFEETPSQLGARFPSGFDAGKTRAHLARWRCQPRTLNPPEAVASDLRQLDDFLSTVPVFEPFQSHVIVAQAAGRGGDHAGPAAVIIHGSFVEQWRAQTNHQSQSSQGDAEFVHLFGLALPPALVQDHPLLAQQSEVSSFPTAEKIPGFHPMPAFPAENV